MLPRGERGRLAGTLHWHATDNRRLDQDQLSLDVKMDLLGIKGRLTLYHESQRRHSTTPIQATRRGFSGVVYQTTLNTKVFKIRFSSSIPKNYFIAVREG